MTGPFILRGSTAVDSALAGTFRYPEVVAILEMDLDDDMRVTVGPRYEAHTHLTRIFHDIAEFEEDDTHPEDGEWIVPRSITAAVDSFNADPEASWMELFAEFAQRRYEYDRAHDLLSDGRAARFLDAVNALRS